MRKRLVLAQRGHKLLQDKLEEMMRRFLILLKEIESAKADFQQRKQNLIRDLLYCRLASPLDDFKKTLSQIKPRMALEVSTLRIMNVKIPVFNLKDFKIEKHYDFFHTSAQMDLAIAQAKDYLESLLKLAQLIKTLEILSFEIERTRRRVNALEYILIPSITDTIRFITQKLNEFERGNLVRLMRVKEIVRSH